MATIEQIKQEMQEMVNGGYLLSFYFYNHSRKGLVCIGIGGQGWNVYYEQYPDPRQESDHR